MFFENDVVVITRNLSTVRRSVGTLIGVVVITIWPLVAVHCSVTTGVAGAIVFTNSEVTVPL
jgi:hypothetical protein